MRSWSAATIPLAAALLLFVLGLYPLANSMTSGTAVPWYPQALKVWVVIGGGLIVLLFIAARVAGEHMDRLWDRMCSIALGIPSPVFVGAASLFAFVASATFAVICFGRQPHNADEVAQLFHAKILLSGRLSLAPDPNPEFFGMDNMIESSRWYSQFPVGGPALLAIGVAIRAAWLLYPAMLGLTVLALYGFARRIFGEPLARGATLLFALCPFALFVGASYMNHVPVLLLTAIALWQLAVWCDAERGREANRAAALIGLAIGVAFTVRPLDAMVVATVVGVMQITQLRGAAHRARSLVPQALAGLVPIALLMYVNTRTTGAPLRLGYEVLYGTAHQLGFHVDPYGTLHTPERAVLFASKYLLGLNVLLFEWPIPAVLVIGLGLVALRRPGKWDFFLLALLFTQLTAYALYWHDGSFRGPRFLFTALPAIVLLAARAPGLIASATGGTLRRTALFALPLSMLFAWAAYGVSNSVPGRVRMYRRGSPVMRVNPEVLARGAGLHNALVFVNEGTQARNQRDLWVLGLSRGNAARLMVTASTCAIRLTIDDAVQRGDSARGAGRDRIIRQAIRFDSVAAHPQACIDFERRDERGMASFAPFFPRNDITPDGRIGGDVVYALDLGEHNEVLRGRFPNRSWYRFGARRSAGDSLPTLMPY